ncbi:MAG: tryptophan synthase subunit beta, partial [Candidatus Diapherotrites archaeon]|nr:tryptophan synthase subunit beta [Candidatus Diapherotrites archaeon]
DAFDTLAATRAFQTEFARLLRDYSGRPTPLYFAKRYSSGFKHLSMYLKREDLNHTGSHKINNTLGQALLANHMGKTRIIAETGAGQHGVATATACARIGMPCDIYMGTIDTRRPAYNVHRMKMLGANVIPVSDGTQTLKDAVNAALKDYQKNFADTHYLIGSVVGPHPFPRIVTYFQSVIGTEARKQFQQQVNGMPNYVVACVGGGSNAAGIFSGFTDTKARLIGVEAGGKSKKKGENAATLNYGKNGLFHGMKSVFLQTRDGQIQPTHSVAAGLDYPGVGPQHAFFHRTKRARYVTVTDREALAAFSQLCTTEGIIPALESSHALAYLQKLDKRLNKHAHVLVCLSGRGDKDVQRRL